MERAVGSSAITSGVIYTENGTQNLAGDMCPECTSVFVNRTVVQGRHYEPGELSDKETPPQQQWEPQ